MGSLMAYVSSTGQFVFNSVRDDWDVSGGSEGTISIRHKAIHLDCQFYFCYTFAGKPVLVFAVTDDGSLAACDRFDIDGWFCGKILSMFPEALDTLPEGDFLSQFVLRFE